MTENDDKYKHIFVSRTFSRFAEENESLIAAVTADDVAAVAAHLETLPDAVLWLNPLKNQSILNEACRLDNEATASVFYGLGRQMDSKV